MQAKTSTLLSLLLVVTLPFLGPPITRAFGLVTLPHFRYQSKVENSGS
jgi:hypothetical protein